jgi:DNA-directed RNA polymerase beta' subunit
VSFARVRIITTELTERKVLGGKDYPFYPVIDAAKGRVTWVDSIRLNNAYTEALGADFDGDRIRVFGLFTQEANAEAERIIRSPKNVAESVGGASRVVKNEGILTIYSLTR